MSTAQAANGGELERAIQESLLLMAGVLANPKEVGVVLVRAWTAVLGSQGLSPDEVRATAHRVMAEEEFFPAPATFLKYARPKADTEALIELAWQRVLSAVRHVGRYGSLAAADFRGDTQALWAISRMGWDRVCRELTEDNRAIWRAEFARVYNAARLAEPVYYLTGEHERQNLSEGRELTPELIGRKGWPAGLPEDRERQLALNAGQQVLASGRVAKALPGGPRFEPVEGKRLDEPMRDAEGVMF
jgi:hypothetical protein